MARPCESVAWALGANTRAYTSAQSFFGEGQSDEQEGLWEHDEAERLRESKVSDPLSAAEPGQLDKLAQWGLGYESRPDSRLEALVKFLDAVCRPDGRHWTNERVVVFTEYAHTVEWLARVLTQHGYGNRLAVIEGSTPTEEREYIRSQFTADPSEEQVRVLLGTDTPPATVRISNRPPRKPQNITPLG